MAIIGNIPYFQTNPLVYFAVCRCELRLNCRFKHDFWQLRHVSAASGGKFRSHSKFQATGGHNEEADFPYVHWYSEAGQVHVRLGSARFELCQTFPAPWRPPMPGLRRLGNKLRGFRDFYLRLLTSALSAEAEEMHKKGSEGLQGILGPDTLRARPVARSWGDAQNSIGRQHEKCCRWFARGRPLARSWGDAQKSIGWVFASRDRSQRLAFQGCAFEGSVFSAEASWRGCDHWEINNFFSGAHGCRPSSVPQIARRRSWAMLLIQFSQMMLRRQWQSYASSPPSYSACGQGVGRKRLSKPWFLSSKSLVNPRKLKTGGSGLLSFGQEVQQRGSFRQSQALRQVRIYQALLKTKLLADGCCVGEKNEDVVEHECFPL